MSYYSEKEIDESGKKILYEIFKDAHPRGAIMSRAHVHTYHELIYIVDGEVTVVLNNQERIVLYKGDVLFIPPGIIHSSHVSASAPCTFGKTITIKFSHHLLFPLANTMSDIRYLVNTESAFDGHSHFPADTDGASLIAPHIIAIMDEIENKSPCYELALRGYLSVIYSTLVRLVGATEPKDERLAKVNTRNAQSICDALSYIENNYREPISLSQVADACGMTYAQLTYLFSKCFVKGFSEYLLDLRLNYAQKLLLKTNMSVTDIALDCGFDNASYFAKKFKAALGMTPKEYRQKYLE
jgi:AraC-like DNA-binding protein